MPQVCIKRNNMLRKSNQLRPKKLYIFEFSKITPLSKKPTLPFKCKKKMKNKRNLFISIHPNQKENNIYASCFFFFFSVDRHITYIKENLKITIYNWTMRSKFENISIKITWKCFLPESLMLRTIKLFTRNFCEKWILNKRLQFFFLQPVCV